MSDDKKDLTRLEDLGEFLHGDDPESDAVFGKEDLSSKTDLSELDDDEFKVLTDEADEDTSTNEPSDLSLEENDLPESLDLQEDASSEDPNPFADSNDEFNVEVVEDQADVFQTDENATDEVFETDTSEVSFDSPEATLEAPQEEFSADEVSFDSPEAEITEETQELGPIESIDIGEDLGIEDTIEGPTEQFDSNSPIEEENNSPVEEFVAQDEFTEQSSIDEEEVKSDPPHIQPLPDEQVVEHSLAPSETAAKPRENFQDLQEFAKSVTYGAVSAGGNPPFSIVIRNIKYQEDAQKIRDILSEHGLLTGGFENDVETGLKNGALLISQISEFSAIYLCHKMRNLDIDLQFGLAHSIHPSQSYTSEDKGLINRNSLPQERSIKLDLDRRPISPDSILVATSPMIEGFRIQSYLNIISTSVSLSEDDIMKPKRSSTPFSHHFTPGKGKEDSIPEEKSDSLHGYYQELSDQLKIKAFKIGANAVVGVSFQLAPVINSDLDSHQKTYKLIAIGNAVILSGQQELGPHAR